MKKCKIVCFDVKSGETKAVTNIESHFINQKPLAGESIGNYINGDYRIKRVVPLGSRSFFPVKSRQTSIVHEATLFLEEV